MLIEGTRRVNNWRLWAIVHEPETALFGTEHDPWSVVDGKAVFTTNPVWEAAVEESDRRNVLYCTLVPLRKWGIG